ncbi:2'-5' RNA ligase family protein [Croceibacterium aestuarii]|uniref:2'-5' RNA ligase family protein n=1 Tax=Croceibacterium aestuarii TaxID=3064139 RepID=UPI00272DE6A1|nr:2'-5' RNA ligase family protein [Croceibacterium sp. D39]
MTRGTVRAGACAAPDTAAGPLIVTAELPRDLQAWANGLRRAHFPPERNFLDAHVTLFHALPPSCEEELRERLAAAAAQPPVPARLLGVMSLGRGVALTLSSPAMLALRADLAERFRGLLTPQDSQRPRLHVTIQNKVEPRAARRLLEELEGSVAPRDFAFAGVGLHRYRGGPWEAVGRWSFRG